MKVIFEPGFSLLNSSLKLSKLCLASDLLLKIPFTKTTVEPSLMQAAETKFGKRKSAKAKYRNHPMEEYKKPCISLEFVRPIVYAGHY